MVSLLSTFVTHPVNVHSYLCKCDKLHSCNDRVLFFSKKPAREDYSAK